jgi:catechol 2,3-dioxygenase-like lactoylglutathione lyase family enzyme
MKLDSAVFYTKDVETITEFYTNVIGLKLDYHQENKYVSFWFENGVRLGIKKAVKEREIPGAQSIFVYVDNLEMLYKKYKSSNQNFYKELVHESWGDNFAILDPDGNKIEFYKEER